MNSLKKSFIYQIAYRILTVITPFITTPIVSRALKADNLGVYSTTQAFANYFIFFAMLGIEKYGQRTIAAASSIEMRQKLFWEIYSVQIVSSLIAVNAYVIAVLIKGGARLIIMLIQGMTVFSCLLNIGWFFFGCEDFEVTVTRSFVVKIITVVLVVVFIKEPDDLTLYTLIMAGGTVVSEGALWFSLFKRIKFNKTSWNNVKPHIRPIFHLFIPVIALSVYHIMDKSMLDLLSTEANAGWYYAVDKIVYIPLGLITAISTVMMTRMSYVVHNEESSQVEIMLTKSSELTMFLTCAVAFGIAAIANEFIPFFFGPGYDPCVELMYLFLPVLVIKALGDVVRTQYLIPAHRDNLYTAAVTCGAITNAIINAPLIISFGAKGAVLGTLSAETVVFLIQIMGCRKEVNFSRIFAKHLYYIFTGTIMFCVARIIANSSLVSETFIKLIIMITTGAIVYCCVCCCIWLARKDSIFNRYIKMIINYKCQL